MFVKIHWKIFLISQKKNKKNLHIMTFDFSALQCDLTQIIDDSEISLLSVDPLLRPSPLGVGTIQARPTSGS